MNRRPQWCIGFARTQAGEEVSRGGAILCSAWEVGRWGEVGFCWRCLEGTRGWPVGSQRAASLRTPNLGPWVWSRLPALTCSGFAASCHPQPPAERGPPEVS